MLYYCILFVSLALPWSVTIISGILDFTFDITIGILCITITNYIPSVTDLITGILK